ncbi:MAG: class I SAM-dependent methyltransferase [Planctomycetota bacterium]|jgi:2-polyprenyl-3-methyl-5-hydroxy-6-metoxy-1,4-benzoquinol methylase
MKDFRKNIYSYYVTKYKRSQLDVDPEWLRSSWKWMEHKYLFLLDGIDKDSPILEVGCGPGYFMEFLENQGFSNVKGIDISAEQVELARKRGFNAEIADVFEYLQDKKDVFKVITAFDFIEHFTKDELMELLPLLYNALKEKGKLITETPNGQGLFPNQIIYGDMTHVTTFNPESLRQILNLHGFSNIEIHETGPVAKNISGCVRLFLWKIIRQIVILIRRIETGKKQTIWTENMICSCQKIIS